MALGRAPAHAGAGLRDRAPDRRRRRQHRLSRGGGDRDLRRLDRLRPRLLPLRRGPRLRAGGAPPLDDRALRDGDAPARASRGADAGLRAAGLRVLRDRPRALQPAEPRGRRPARARPDRSRLPPGPGPRRLRGLQLRQARAGLPAAGDRALDKRGRRAPPPAARSRRPDPAAARLRDPGRGARRRRGGGPGRPRPRPGAGDRRAGRARGRGRPGLPVGAGAGRDGRPAAGRRLGLHDPLERGRLSARRAAPDGTRRRSPASCRARSSARSASMARCRARRRSSPTATR